MGLKASEYQVLKEWRDHPSYSVLRNVIEVLSLRDNDDLLSVQPENTSNYLRGKIAGFVEVYELADTLVHTVEEYNARKRATDDERASVAALARGTDTANRWGSATYR